MRPLALNVATYADMAIRGRPSGSVPARMDGVLADKAGIPLSAGHAYRNPVHERAAKECIAARYPDLAVCLSSDIWPQQREYERAMQTPQARMRSSTQPSGPPRSGPCGPAWASPTGRPALAQTAPVRSTAALWAAGGSPAAGGANRAAAARQRAAAYRVLPTVR